MADKNEVVTQTGYGTLIQLDGRETDLDGNPISKKDVEKAQAEAGADATPDAAAVAIQQATEAEADAKA